MKLASYIVDGIETFGVIRGNDVITMNGRFGGRGATLRDALAADLLPQIKDSISQCEARPHDLRYQIPAGDPESRADRLRRHQLPLTRERDRPRDPETAVDVPAAHRYAGRVTRAR